MTTGPQLLSELRAATDAQHRQLESVRWLENLTSDTLSVAQYHQTLQCFSYYYGVLETLWEPWLQQTGYAYTRRFPLLQQDLHDLNEAVEAEQAVDLPVSYPASPANLSEFAGMLYVVEGSSQGSRVIGPRLQRKLGFNREHGARFFNIHQLAPDSWTQFRSWLEKNEQKLSITDSISGASRVFSTLYQSFKQCESNPFHIKCTSKPYTGT